MQKISPYYELNGLEEDDYDPFGVAYFPEPRVLDTLPATFTPMVNWSIPRAELRDGCYHDFLANNACVRLISDRLYRFIESHRNARDELQWLPVVVTQGDDTRDYQILHFKRDIDPLNRAVTKWIGGWYPRVPVIRKELVGQHDVFGLRTNGYSFVVSQKIQRLVENEFDGCFTYRPLAVA